MAGEEFHLDRERAEIFGSIAGQYERYRPNYPEALIDDLAALRPECVLDIGCGTGRVAAALMKRGLPVLGVELDERMAEVARGRGVPVEVAAFEDWDGAGWRFDLITCGAAWHWIDPERGAAKVAEMLRAGGTMARFWSYHELDPDVRGVLDAIYREHAPDSHSHGTRPEDNGDYTDPFATAGFSPVEHKVYHWERTWSADEWVGLVATFSDHQRLGPERLAVLLREVHAAVESFGGSIEDRGGAFAVLTQREG